MALQWQAGVLTEEVVLAVRELVEVCRVGGIDIAYSGPAIGYFIINFLVMGASAKLASSPGSGIAIVITQSYVDTRGNRKRSQRRVVVSLI